MYVCSWNTVATVSAQVQYYWTRRKGIFLRSEVQTCNETRVKKVKLEQKIAPSVAHLSFFLETKIWLHRNRWIRAYHKIFHTSSIATTQPHHFLVPSPIKQRSHCKVEYSTQRRHHLEWSVHVDTKDAIASTSTRSRSPSHQNEEHITSKIKTFPKFEQRSQTYKQSKKEANDENEKKWWILMILILMIPTVPTPTPTTLQLQWWRWSVQCW